jgi:hypothetical protein
MAHQAQESFCTYKARLRSFSSRKPGFRWTHKHLHKEEMARVGFFFCPQQGMDTVRCFYCEVTLSAWQPGDIALTKHLGAKQRSKMCNWAVMLSPRIRSSRTSFDWEKTLKCVSKLLPLIYMTLTSARWRKLGGFLLLHSRSQLDLRSPYKPSTLNPTKPNSRMTYPTKF